MSPEPFVDAGLPGDSGAPDASRPPPECIEDPAVDDRVVDERCGVFVAPFPKGGDDTASGTREEPVATLAAAVRRARAKRLPRVYACNAVFEEALVLDGALDGVSLVGGLTCPPRPTSREGAWIYHEGTRATLKASPGHVAPVLEVRDHQRETLIDGFEILGHRAVEPGGTAVAMHFVGKRRSPSSRVRL